MSVPEEDEDEVRARLSHDLRTPLAVIVGYAELLGARGADPEFRRTATERIMEAAQRLSASLDAMFPPDPR